MTKRFLCFYQPSPEGAQSAVNASGYKRNLYPANHTAYAPGFTTS